MELTTYRAKGKEIGLVFLFKYDLNGNLKLFEIEEGTLSIKQENWLFNINNFPSNELKMKHWAKSEEFNKKFEVSVSPADISFDSIWNLYNHKVSRFDAEKQFKKLKHGEVIKCFIEIPYYLETLKKNPGLAKLHLATYINKRRFDDERPKETIKVGKVFNPVLKDLAVKKTEK